MRRLRPNVSMTFRLPRIERLRVRGADVVALEEALGEDLPVDRDLERRGVQEAVLRADHRREPVEIGVRRRRSVLRDEYHAADLRDRGDRHETARALVEAGESVLVRHVAQSAVERVRPSVVAAHERALAAGAGGELGAAMTTRVAKRAHATVGTAHREDRRPRRVAGDVRPDLRQGRRGAERRRITAQDELALGGEALRRRVVRDRLTPRLVAHIGRAVVDVIEDALHDGRIVFEGHRAHARLLHVSSPRRQSPDA